MSRRKRRRMRKVILIFSSFFLMTSEPEKDRKRGRLENWLSGMENGIPFRSIPFEFYDCLIFVYNSNQVKKEEGDGEEEDLNSEWGRKEGKEDAQQVSWTDVTWWADEWMSVYCLLPSKYYFSSFERIPEWESEVQKGRRRGREQSRKKKEASNAMLIRISCPF